MICTYRIFGINNTTKHIIDFEVAHDSAVKSVALFILSGLNYGIVPTTISFETLVDNKPSYSDILEKHEKHHYIIWKKPQSLKNTRRKDKLIRAWRITP